MRTLDTDKIAGIIRAVADQEIATRFNNLKTDDVWQKSPDDYLTIADEQSEKLLTQLLREALPGSLVVGEEAVSKDPSVMDRLKEDKPVWVIDPIDGTYNFSHGIERFGIFVSLVQNGETLYGWAYDVPGNRMAIAIKDGGAFVDGKQVHVHEGAKEPKEIVIGCGRKQTENLQSVAPIFAEVVNHRCAVFDAFDLITGKVDATTHRKIRPWDHSALALLLQEAGGYLAVEHGEEYNPCMHKDALLISAANKGVWETVYNNAFTVLNGSAIPPIKKRSIG